MLLLQWDLFYKYNPHVSPFHREHTSQPTSLIHTTSFILFHTTSHVISRFARNCFSTSCRPSSQVKWDGTPIGTLSIVILADDIDANARIHWLAVNIDPREHEFFIGQSGRCNWWQMLYNRCPAGRLPASTLELPNRWRRWRYTSFCPPADKEHRYRIRVFAQVSLWI